MVGRWEQKTDAGFENEPKSNILGGHKRTSDDELYMMRFYEGVIFLRAVR